MQTLMQISDGIYFADTNTCKTKNKQNKHQYESIRLDQEDNTAYVFCRLSSDNGLIVMLDATEEE